MKQKTVRILCWVLAGLMLFGVVAAIIGIMA